MKRVAKQIEAERRELQSILSKGDLAGPQMQRLKDLALQVGASTTKLHPGYGDASVPEIAHNIHVALQTKTIIAALQTSRSHLCVAVILAAIAFLSMAATWVMLFVVG